MDNTVIKDVLLDKKLDRYGFDNNDFLAAGELTVTVTLSEYRKLVKDVATAQEGSTYKWQRKTMSQW